MSDDRQKVEITIPDLAKISEHASKAFEDSQTFGRMNSREIQIYLILKGLESFLSMRGAEPNFDINISTKKFKY